MMWTDLELGWNESVKAVMLPVDKIWTPVIVLDNAIDVNIKPYTNDVLVLKDGTVDYAILLFVAVGCDDINLFNYPFVNDNCRVAINGWNKRVEDRIHHAGMDGLLRNCATGCRVDEAFTMDDLVDSISADTSGLRCGHVQLRIVFITPVSLSVSPFSAVVTLILPSILIMLADLVTFALPVQGGERNNLKVTLVLSFTMFLLILNDHLASGGRCSPILHYHFCFCLVNLVLSMMMSILLTRLTLDDRILSCKCSKNLKKPPNASLGQDEGKNLEY
ncbi:5-hydroxytryptamine receptor 3A [Anabarilius grahami]|uniref:5-hydroxytryptamine receptor 3A n=1 Tax=Anabarilius grahami TaxID=495550 RepID=A0A3N0YII9_ANAGA|nr:5-hydroxytryptamine receptor 3A [Anabarilius grahami]